MDLPSIYRSLTSITRTVGKNTKFTGFYRTKIDQKYRLTFPTALQKGFTEKEIFLILATTKEENVLSAGHKILAVLEKSIWIQNLNKVPVKERDSLTGFSFNSKVSSAGRINISQRLTEELGFERGGEVFLVGCGSHVQIWKKEDWKPRPITLL